MLYLVVFFALRILLVQVRELLFTLALLDHIVQTKLKDRGQDTTSTCRSTATCSSLSFSYVSRNLLNFSLAFPFSRSTFLVHRRSAAIGQDLAFLQFAVDYPTVGEVALQLAHGTETCARMAFRYLFVQGGAHTVFSVSSSASFAAIVRCRSSVSERFCLSMASY